jgi:hypothetical protein
VHTKKITGAEKAGDIASGTGIQAILLKRFKRHVETAARVFR